MVEGGVLDEALDGFLKSLRLEVKRLGFGGGDERGFLEEFFS